MSTLSINLTSGPINVPAAVNFCWSLSFANGASADTNSRIFGPRRRQPEQEVATAPRPYEESHQRRHVPVCYRQIFESLGLADLGSLCASSPAWAGPTRRFILKALLPKPGVNLPPALPPQTARIPEDFDDAAILALGPVVLAQHGIDAQGNYCRVCEEHLGFGVTRHFFGMRGRRHNGNVAIWTNAYDEILTHGRKLAHQGMQLLSGSAMGKVYCNACKESMNWWEATCHSKSKSHWRKSFTGMKTIYSQDFHWHELPEPPMHPSEPDDVLEQSEEAGQTAEAIRNGGNGSAEPLKPEFVSEPVEIDQQSDIPAQDPIVKEELLDVVPEDPFPTAVMHIDEDQERDVQESLRTAPVIPAVEPGMDLSCMQNNYCHTASDVATDSGLSADTCASWVSGPQDDGNRCFCTSVLFEVVDSNSGLKRLCRGGELQAGMEVRGLYRNLLVERVTMHPEQQCEIVELNVGDDVPPLTVTGNHRVVTHLQAGSAKTRLAGDLEIGDIVCCEGSSKELKSLTKVQGVMDVACVMFKPDEPVIAFNAPPLADDNSAPGILTKGQKRIRRGGMRCARAEISDNASIPDTEGSFA